MLTSAFIKEKAKQFGADLCGIGDISLFEGTPAQRDPRLICPKAKGYMLCSHVSKEPAGMVNLGINAIWLIEPSSAMKSTVRVCALMRWLRAARESLEMLVILFFLLR